MPSANIESDPLFVLLTDALRAGPGSSQWQDAIAALKQQGLEGADEHRMLIEARESLEGGKEYRAVRAGPGFTRKLMGEIENESAGGRRTGIPTATIVAIVCGLLILAAVAYVGYKLVPPTSTGQVAIDELENKSHRFFDSVASAMFAGSLPTGWHQVGGLRLRETAGLQPDPDVDQTSKGGGVVWSGSMPAAQAFAVDVTVTGAQPAGSLLLEAFVSTDSNFSADKGTSSRDLVWQLQGRDQHVLLSGSGQALGAPPAFQPGDTIRLIVDKSVAIVELISANGGKTQRLWAGNHELGADPRFVGVRFLQTGAPGKQDLSVQQIKLTTAPG